MSLGSDWKLDEQWPIKYNKESVTETKLHASRSKQNPTTRTAELRRVRQLKTYSVTKLYLISVEIVGSQNKFSSPPTPFETRGRNVTVCPANMCCYHSNTFSITEMLSL
jgi:hypothetical protein